MIQRLVTAALFLTLFAGVGLAQENLFPKFKQFKEVAPGVDFYASEKSEVDPFIKPLTDARQKMASFLGPEIAKGAVFICSTLAQKDTVYDQRAFKVYKWYLIQLTAEAQREERMARMQAQAAAGAMQSGQGEQVGRGGQGSRTDQAGQGSRGAQSGQSGRGGQSGPGSSQSPEFRAAAEARLATQLASQVCYATLMTSHDNAKPFRASRLNDMSRSPLNDWLDIALVANVMGTAQNSYRVLQERVDDCFPLDDVLSMSRPFVAQTDSTSGGGGGGMSGGNVMIMGGGGERGGSAQGATVVMMGGGGDRGTSGGQAGGDRAGSGQPGGRGSQGGAGRGGAGRVLAKDEVDRMVFDAQAAAFFSYLIEKAGMDKAKDLVQQNMKKTETLQVVQSILGPDADQLERDFMAWVSTKK